jgi:hypothetical protein
MHDYYNQPETLLEDIPESTEPVQVVVGIPLIDADGISMATGGASLGATGEISDAKVPEVSGVTRSGDGDGVTITTDDVTASGKSELPTAGLSTSTLAALDKAKDMQKQLDEFFKQGREQKCQEETVEDESS